MAEPVIQPIDVSQVTSGDYDGTVFVGDDTAAGKLITGTGGDLDVMFVLVSGYLVFFMQCGFAMLSAGSVRHKNCRNIILKNLLDACFGAICFYFVGYGFAYGGDNGNKFIGYGGFVLKGEARGAWYNWFFQFAFAATAATIVSGAVAERCKFEAYILYAGLLTTWVYPVVVHWVWSSTGWASAFRADGLLFGTGVIDFAGCGVVHMVGGLAALAGAMACGPRLGRFNADGKPQDIAGHNASLAVLGVFILWFGWYGFNPGSALAILGAGEVASLCAINTTLSAAGGTVSTLLTLGAMKHVSTGKSTWDLIGASNGTLAGLVGITSACSVAEPHSALAIGVISGWVYVAASWFVLNVLKVDDPLDAAAVHGFTGMWGLIAAALFADKVPTAAAYGDALVEEGFGLFLGGGGKLLGAAIVVILAISVWVLGHMLPFFYLLKFLGLLRVGDEEEKIGLDVSHGMGTDSLYSNKEALKKRLDDLEAEIMAQMEASK